MKINVCNLRSNEFEKDFVDSIVNTGFAVITHHGVDFGLIKETQAAWRTFFNQNRSYKEYFRNLENPNMGFTGFGGEKAVGASVPDLKEYFHWRPGSSLPLEVTAVTQKMYYMLKEDVSNKLLAVLDTVRPGTQYRQACENSDNTLLRALYYPALSEIERSAGAVRGSAHEDINFITLLVAASAPGLQVQDRSGNWHAVPYEENSIVVNIGDSLELASGGLFKSTTHRVVNPQELTTDRISLPVFIHPHSTTILSSGVVAQDFLWERLNKIYVKESQKNG